ncbi:MAG: TorF family putative porin [Candidatus Competibacterales bacterium]|nr:TorF family putative porin [Candidatus Competibacterales bacterium]
MKSFHKAMILSAALAPAAAANADTSFNVGWMSEYIFRGIPQSDSSAFAGVDYTNGGFYAGTWAADVGQGLETDLYLGYGGEAGDFTYSVGYTGYFYTDDFDDTYNEINLGVGYGMFSVDAAFGTYDNFDGPTLDYNFVSMKFERDGFYLLGGAFGNDFEGEYFESGYGFSFGRFDVGVSYVHSTADLIGDDDNALIFTLSTSFDSVGSGGADE